MVQKIRRTHQLRLVLYPIIYRVLYIPGGDRQISSNNSMTGSFLGTTRYRRNIDYWCFACNVRKVCFVFCCRHYFFRRHGISMWMPKGDPDASYLEIRCSSTIFPGQKIDMQRSKEALRFVILSILFGVCHPWNLLPGKTGKVIKSCLVLYILLGLFIRGTWCR